MNWFMFDSVRPGGILLVKWKEELVVKQSIDKVWQFFLDKNAHLLYSKLEDHVLVENENDELGAKHAQSYKEGNQLQTYVVETMAFDDTPKQKIRRVRFTLNGMFEIEYKFTLDKKEENITLFTYEGYQKGITLTAKAMLIAGSKKRRKETVRNFMKRVGSKAEKTASL